MRFKRLALLTPLLSSLFLLCNCNKLPSKVNTLYGINNENNRQMQYLNKSELDAFMDKDELKTFILVQTTKNCSCSKEFETIVNNYVKQTGLLIYYSDYEEIKDTNYGFALRDSKPTFHVILKGKNLGNLEKYDDDKFRSNQETFNSFMNEHISKPSLFKVDETELDNLYTNDNPFAIYFAKSDCIECKYFDSFILNDYAQSHLENMKKMYYFDFKGIEKEEASILKTKYKLKNGDDWGYKEGALPVFHYVENKIATQGLMFGNDILDNNNVVTESYYNSERVTNKIQYSRMETTIGKAFEENQTRMDGTYKVLNNATNDILYRDASFRFLDYVQERIS